MPTALASVASVRPLSVSDEGVPASSRSRASASATGRSAWAMATASLGVKRLADRVLVVLGAEQGTR